MARGLDGATRAWWRLVGRRIDPAGPHAWLEAPVHEGGVVGDRWPAAEAARHGGRVLDHDDRAGLIPDLAALDGPGFDAGRVHPGVRDFYEHTGSWRMEVWSQWNPVFAPGGALVAALFGRRVEQLAIPVRPLAVAHGMDSTVRPIVDAGGRQVAAAWVRTLRADGAVVYSGCYATRRLPGADRASVHVAFPLQSGNVQVFLRPDVDAAGGLWLRSPSGRFGADGAYVVVRSPDGTHAARVPLHETFHVAPDRFGVLRCDHDLRWGSAPVLRLHYRLERADRPGTPPPTGAGIS